jgi:hypothetical protein
MKLYVGRLGGMHCIVGRVSGLWSAEETWETVQIAWESHTLFIPSSRHVVPARHMSLTYIYSMYIYILFTVSLLDSSVDQHLQM